MSNISLSVLIASLALQSSIVCAQTHQLLYDGFRCDVFGSKALAPKVLENDRTKLAYDLSVTELGPTDYVAVFHAEPYEKEAGCAGDSIAVRYASSPDGHFGFRSADQEDDYVITRTENPSRMMSSDDCGGVGGLSGGGNPILLKRQAEPDTPEWALYYLSVSDYAEGVERHTGSWRHYLMVAHPLNVFQMTSSPWFALSRNGSRADYWHYFPDGPPVFERYQPWPVRVRSSQQLLQSANESPNENTQGLIGSMSYNAQRDRIHYFYLDEVNGQHVTFRQDMDGLNEVNWWGDRRQIRSDWIEATYHLGRQKWAVLSLCYDQGNAGWDVCLQFTSGSDVAQIEQLPTANQPQHGLGLAAHFHDQHTGGVMEQFGYLKNAYGQIPSDDFRIYVGERDAGGQANGLYGMDVYSVKLTCQCVPRCDGRQCGEDGCGGSCGECSISDECNAAGQCVSMDVQPEVDLGDLSDQAGLDLGVVQGGEEPNELEDMLNDPNDQPLDQGQNDGEDEGGEASQSMNPDSGQGDSPSLEEAEGGEDTQLTSKSTTMGCHALRNDVGWMSVGWILLLLGVCQRLDRRRDQG